MEKASYNLVFLTAIFYCLHFILGFASTLNFSLKRAKPWRRMKGKRNQRSTGRKGRGARNIHVEMPAKKVKWVSGLFFFVVVLVAQTRGSRFNLKELPAFNLLYFLILNLLYCLILCCKIKHLG